MTSLVLIGVGKIDRVAQKFGIPIVRLKIRGLTTIGYVAEMHQRIMHQNNGFTKLELRGRKKSRKLGQIIMRQLMAVFLTDNLSIKTISNIENLISPNKGALTANYAKDYGPNKDCGANYAKDKILALTAHGATAAPSKQAENSRPTCNGLECCGSSNAIVAPMEGGVISNCSGDSFDNDSTSAEE
ncbi:unnamed protein product [Ilex paraguariensis]|uniref:Uncharacterized protein n=1 Tax=Ilex paraguariensis TaxID=185542 RepID=A0ABC8R4A8_9AQUA